MVYYRLYQLRGLRNEVESFHEFNAEDDSAAVAVGETLHRSNPMELWAGHRKVRRWDETSHVG
jgi:hypothetical protein